MANIDPEGDARREIIGQLRDHGVTPADCMIQNIQDDEGFWRLIAILKDTGVPVARSYQFRPTVCGSFVDSISSSGRRA